ncbi:MAG: MFS transporter [Bradyrhizobiaceae bacterium]|nr:MAG: MFS transporter [Bradyrhizobiaceae bacterium]
MTQALHSSNDAATVQAVEGTISAARPDMVLAATILASSLAFVDSSVVNVGLPVIGRSLGADAGAQQWIINAYLLPLSALLLLGGAAGDRFGRRRMLIGGVALFALASIACAGAPNLVAMQVARFAQGAAAAALMPSSLAILGQTFSGEAKGRAIGLWASTGAVTAAIGPIFGGWLIDLGGWRGIFLINVPLAAAAIWLALRFVPPDEKNGDMPLDIAGGILATLALGGLTWALTVGSGPGGWTFAAAAMLVVSCALLLLFLYVEKRKGDHAMMPLALFVSRRFIGLTLLTLFLYAVLGALIVLLPYVLIVGAGYSSIAAGAALLPLPIVLSAMSPVMGGLAGRFGSRLLLGIGPLGVAAGFLLMLRIEGSTAYWSEIVPAIVVLALGMSCAVAPLTTAVLSSVDSKHMGSASGFNSAIARTGGLIATAMLGSVLAAEGLDLFSQFHIALIVAAMASVFASLAAFAFVDC